MHSIYNYIDSHTYILDKEKKGKKNMKAQQPPSLHGRSDTRHSWKEKKKKKMSL